jgi:hypothetical protein
MTSGWTFISRTQSGANESVMNNHQPAPSYWLWFDVGLRAGLEILDRLRKLWRFGELETLILPFFQVANRPPLVWVPHPEQCTFRHAFL